jgi:hypothetical protein
VDSSTILYAYLLTHCYFLRRQTPGALGKPITLAALTGCVPRRLLSRSAHGEWSSEMRERRSGRQEPIRHEGSSRRLPVVKLSIVLVWPALVRRAA